MKVDRYLEEAAMNITGTPVEMAERLRAILDFPQQAADTLPDQERRKLIAEERRRSWQRQILRHRLSREFGMARGWKLTDRAFSVKVLARGGVWDGRGGCPLSCWPHEFADHPFFYRMGTRAAALVSHPYGMSASSREAARVWASQNGLSVAFPDDFPSWWFPGDTTLVVFTRAAGG